LGCLPSAIVSVVDRETEYYVDYSVCYGVFTRFSKRLANFRQMYSKYTC